MVAIDVREVWVVRLVSALQPVECSVDLAGAQVKLSDFVERHVNPGQLRRKQVAATAHDPVISLLGKSESHGFNELRVHPYASRVSVPAPVRLRSALSGAAQMRGR
jgi:hypothetical protein